MENQFIGDSFGGYGKGWDISVKVSECICFEAFPFIMKLVFKFVS